MSAGRLTACLFLALLSALGCRRAAAYYDPMVLCAGKPDRSQITLTGEDLPGYVYGRRLERAIVTCSYGSIGGPATLTFDDTDSAVDASFANLPVWTLPTVVRRIEATVVTGGFSTWFFKGLVRAFDRQDRLIFQVEYRYGKPWGPAVSWSPEYGIQTLAAFSHDSQWLPGGLHGRVASWYANGQLAAVGYYCIGLPIGLHVHFDSTGRMTRAEDYSDSDYADSGHRIREVWDPKRQRSHIIILDSERGDLDPLAPLLYARAIRKTRFADSRPSEIAISSAPQEPGAWITLPPGATIARWFTAGSVIRAEGIVSLPPATLQVKDTYQYTSLNKLPPQATKPYQEIHRHCDDLLDEASRIPYDLAVPVELLGD